MACGDFHHFCGSERAELQAADRGLRRLFPLPRKPVPVRLAERALSVWKCRKVPEEVGSNFQRISRGCVWGGGNCGEGSPPLGGIFARNLRLAAPASRPSPSGLFSSSLGEAGGGEGGGAGAHGGGAGLGAGVSAPRASHHLAEPLLKTHPSVRADTAFLPEEKKNSLLAL